MSSRFDRQRGSATVWVLAVGTTTMFVALAAAAVGTATVARHRAQAAADLAALAAAAEATAGETAACARAGRLAAADGARLVGCALEGWDAVVTVEVSPGRLAAAAGSARASARAGPVDS